MKQNDITNLPNQQTFNNWSNDELFNYYYNLLNEPNNVNNAISKIVRKVLNTRNYK